MLDEQFQSACTGAEIANDSGMRGVTNHSHNIMDSTHHNKIRSNNRAIGPRLFVPLKPLRVTRVATLK